MLKYSLLSCVAILAFTPAAFAAGKTYQVTGPVLELTDSKIVVQKGDEKWELAHDKAAVPAGVKVGNKVTVEYTMTAVKVTDKGADKAPEKK